MLVKSTTFVVLLTAFVCGLNHRDAQLQGAEKFELKEGVAPGRVFDVSTKLSVAGKIYTQPGPEKAIKLAVDARFRFGERRLEGAGREAQTLRAVRYYSEAEASITAGTQLSNPSLRDSMRLIVAGGASEGIELFSPSGPLTYDEIELLRSPGDSLAVVGLLPGDAVEIGETWQPAEWVLLLLTGIEAAEKASLVCKLESVESKAARVSFEGEITGAILGAPANVKVSGHFVYDLEGGYLTSLELAQAEKRSIGTVSPGLDVSAKVLVTRALDPRPRRLTDNDLARVSLEPNEASRLLMFDAPAWNVRFYHDRHWHLFHQSSETAILRLLDKGGLISQCNIKKLPDAAPGKHVAEEQFQADVKQALGKNFQELAQSEVVKLRDDLFVYRVVALGTVDRRNEKNEPVVSPMQWNYYLVSHSSGRQLAFVFTVDPKLAENFESRDLAIVGGLEFLAPRPVSEARQQK